MIGKNRLPIALGTISAQRYGILPLHWLAWRWVVPEEAALR